MITQVTFTGIDARTDIGRLQSMRLRYPFVEFGLLVAASRQGKENRYPDLDILKDLHGAGLHLSCHVCGSLARKLINNATRYNRAKDSFVELDEYLGGRLHVFQRVQLNVSNMDKYPMEIFLHAPRYIDEIIIQQKPDNFDLYAHTLSNIKTGILLDASGGEGIETTFAPKWSTIHTGFAGGLKSTNVAEKIQPLLHNRLLANNRHWIDMESGVRTDDWFDPDKVEEVIRIVSPYIKTK